MLRLSVLELGRGVVEYKTVLNKQKEFIMVMFEKYDVVLEMLSPILGSCPAKADIYKQHIIESANKQIKELSKKIPKGQSVNKYQGEKEISKEKEDNEISAIFKNIEGLIARQLSQEEKELILKGDYDALDEIIEEASNKTSTIFLKDKDGLPFLSGHVIKGFLKNAAEQITRTREKKNGLFLGSATASIAYLNNYVGIGTNVEFFFNGKKCDIDKDLHGNTVYLERPLRAKTAKGERVSLASSEIISNLCDIKFQLRILKGAPIPIEQLFGLFEFGEISGLSQWRNSSLYGNIRLKSYSLVP